MLLGLENYFKQTHHIMAHITLKRTSQYASKWRKIKIFLNDSLLYEIKDGEEKTCNLPVGKYEIYAKIDWCSSEKIMFDLVLPHINIVG